MIFVFGDEGSLFVMLSEKKDLKILREKRTLFVDQRQLQGKLEKTDQDSIELIRQAGHKVDQLACAEPAPHESTCIGCFGLIATTSLLDGKCIACWRQQVKDLLTQSN